MASDNLGYRYGKRKLVSYPVDASSAAIVEGDMLNFGTAGFVTVSAADDNRLVGWAAEGCASPAADGDISILVDTSYDSVYRMTADTAPTASDRGRVCDVGGARTAKVSTSADDMLFIEEIDIANTQVLVSRNTVPVAPITGT